MAKKSAIARELQKAKTVAKYAGKVAQIKAKIREEILADQQDGGGSGVFEACMRLNKLPRNASRVRGTRRCNSCGRPHGVYRAYGLCRICLRQAAMRGDVPGMVKSSW